MICVDLFVYLLSNNIVFIFKLPVKLLICILYKLIYYKLIYILIDFLSKKAYTNSHSLWFSRFILDLGLFCFISKAFKLLKYVHMYIVQQIINLIEFGIISISYINIIVFNLVIIFKFVSPKSFVLLTILFIICECMNMFFTYN